MLVTDKIIFALNLVLKCQERSKYWTKIFVFYEIPTTYWSPKSFSSREKNIRIQKFVPDRKKCVFLPFETYILFYGINFSLATIKVDKRNIQFPTIFFLIS